MKISHRIYHRLLYLRRFNMLVHYDINRLPAFRNAVVTIGTFDGVHLGHQQIILQLKTEAAIVNGESVIITFHPHPRKVVSEKEIFILTTPEEKIQLLEKKGIDHLVVVPFDESFSEQSPETYIENFLFDKCRPHTVIIGYDHKFGKGRKGNYKLLEAYSEKLGFTVKEIPEHVLNDVVISSTKIREALLHGDVQTANIYLGYHYFFEGTVVAGDKIGRTLGYPTANLRIKDKEKLVPGNGVYAVTADLFTGDTIISHQGMMSIGVRPTINGKTRMIEVNIFDFNEDIYGQKMRVHVHHYLREEIKFDNLDGLKEQIAKDKIKSIELLAQ